MCTTKQNNQLYCYDGPVYHFDKLLTNHFVAETIAGSEAKARTNLAYRFKKKYGYANNTCIKITGKFN